MAMVTRKMEKPGLEMVEALKWVVKNMITILPAQGSHNLTINWGKLKTGNCICKDILAGDDGDIEAQARITKY